MWRTLEVARREFRETALRKGFLLQAALPLAILAGIVFFTGRTMSRATSPHRQQKSLRVAIADETDWAAERLRALANDPNGPLGPNWRIQFTETIPHPDQTRLDALAADVRQGQLDAYIHLKPNFPASHDSAVVYTKPFSFSNMDQANLLTRLVNHAAFLHRANDAGVSPALVGRLRAPAALHLELRPDGGPETTDPTSRMAQTMAPFAFVFLMFMAIMTTGQYLLGNIIEEKSSRIVEVLLASVKPAELMAGKIIGLGLAGLLIASWWLIAAYAGIRLRGIQIDLPADLTVWFLAYFVLGYLLMAALMAGAGSLCSEPKEAASIIGPVNILMVIPMIGWFHFAQNPNALAARVLSFIPPMTPLMMMLRLGSGSIPQWEIAATLALLALSTYLATRLAGRVFRIGLLLTGKRPSLKSLYQALRTP